VTLAPVPPARTVALDLADAVDGGSLLIAGAIIAAGYVVKIVAVCVVPSNRRPASAMAWLMLILAAPLGGLLLFLTLGRTSLGRRRRDRRRGAQDAIRAHTAELVPSAATEPPYVA